MERLSLDLKEKRYDIVFSADFSGLLDCLAEVKASGKLLLVTDSNVESLYAGTVKKLLSGNGYDVGVFAFQAGEMQKHMDTILDICGACVEHGMDRRSMIIALGGGVVGDMAGFASAIYMRGIPFIQVPTTLLSQTDSSVGGKTGIDFQGGKNILGAFHQPRLVYINVSTLKTLPEREFISGMGEVIKHGIIRDAEFFAYLEQNYDKIAALEPADLIQMTKKNCGIKGEIVMQDAYETGLRANLNFGHTIGHAVESYFNFTWSHGECVGIGMVAASYIAYRREMIPKKTLLRIESILKLYGFRTRAEILNAAQVISLLQKDKKKINGQLKFILPVQIGSVVQVTDVTELEILDALAYINERG